MILIPILAHLNWSRGSEKRVALCVNAVFGLRVTQTPEGVSKRVCAWWTLRYCNLRHRVVTIPRVLAF